MTLTQAIVAREPHNAPEVNWAMEEVEVSTPGDHELLVEICAAGICHSDILFGSLPSTGGGAYPKVLGHEGAGYVRSIGAKVQSAQVGDPVLLSFYHCGLCKQCESGHPAYCDSFMAANIAGQKGYMKDKTGKEDIWALFFGQSSFARHTVVAESSVVNLKGSLQNETELRMFAPLGCGFQTGMGAVENVAAAGPNDTVLIVGLGAVGFGALMIAKIRGCKAIIAVDKVSHRLKLASELGATHTLDASTSPDFDLAKAVRELLPGGVSVAIDATGVPQVVESSAQALAPQGCLVLVGAVPGGYQLPLNVTEFMVTGRVIKGCIEGDCVPNKAIPQMIQWYREGNFPVDKLITCFPAEKFQDALHEAHQGTAVKPVLYWN